MTSRVRDPQPDVAGHRRAALSCSLARAVAPTFRRRVSVNSIRVGNLFSLNVLHADRSSGSDKSLFSEAAPSFRAKRLSG